MTLEELREKPAGVLETRNFFISVEEITYSMGKLSDDTYFIGYLDDGSDCSVHLSEDDMLCCINNKELSDFLACDIYLADPHRSFWVDD